jgi:hypothetical protein
MHVKVNECRFTGYSMMFDPQIYVFDFSMERKITKMLLVDEENLSAAPFIDINFEPMAKGHFFLPTMKLLELENEHNIQRPRSSFIFHHAFVCSTLLARCLDQLDAFFSLKEPWIMRRLADTKRNPDERIPRTEWKRMFQVYMMQLARNYTSGKAPVIKATNVANNLIPDVMKYLPGHGITYLYSGLENFLVSNLKKPEETKQKIPGLASQFANDEGFARLYPGFSDTANWTFLQACAVMWLSSLYNFHAYWKKIQCQNVCTIEADSFLQKPEQTLKALATFFGHEPDDPEVSRMTSTEVMGSNAKNSSQAFGAKKRASESKLILETHGKEIRQTVAWIDPLLRDLGLMEFMSSLHLVR